MLTKNQIKLIASLKQKKYRQEENLFVAEGEKLVVELITAGLTPVYICVVETEGKHENLTKNPKTTIVSTVEMARISGLTNPSSALAVFKIPEQNLSFSKLENQLLVALDGIQDPGNLGTIIRLCVWFGVSNLVCSVDTADCFNPKVVQASMGALAKVKVHYTDLSSFLEAMQSSSVPIFGTYLEGKNIYNSQLPKNGVIVMGNEGNGISSVVEKFISNKITIPSFAKEEAGAESLNVATATAIVLSEFRRGNPTA
jgi:TrmH family RNA methyltransferase